MTVSAADYARMPWHARQRLNENIKRETAALAEQLRQMRAETKVAAKHHRPMTAEMIEAARILATLPTDPNATAHRLTTWGSVR